MATHRRVPPIFPFRHGLAAIGALLLVTFLTHKAPGQVIQLPTYRTFGIGTTVLVPDRGTVELGRVTRGQIGTISRGVPVLGRIPGLGPVFRQRSVGASLGTSSVSVTARILDLEAMDRAVLQEAAALRENRLRVEREAAIRQGRRPLSQSDRKKAAFLSRNVGRSDR